MSVKLINIVDSLIYDGFLFELLLCLNCQISCGLNIGFEKILKSLNRGFNIFIKTSPRSSFFGNHKKSAVNPYLT